MPMIDLLGYLAGACLLMMASMKTQLAMRLCNMAGNVCFIAYGFMAGVMPVFILNIVIMCLHFWRILQERQAGTDSKSTPPVPVTEPAPRIRYRGVLYQRVDPARGN